MKKKSHPRQPDYERDEPRRVIQSIILSPGLRRMRLKIDELRYALARHRLFDRLPCMFRTEKGTAFGAVSTTDLRKTLLFLPREREAFLKGLELREINERTLAE